MGITSYGKSGTALLWSVSGTRPQFFGIGSGSGTFMASNGSLFAEVSNRVSLGSADISTAQAVSWTVNYSAVTMSGINLREFGVFIGSSGTGMYSRDTFNTINFDGTNELQVNVTYNIF